MQEHSSGNSLLFPKANAARLPANGMDRRFPSHLLQRGITGTKEPPMPAHSKAAKPSAQIAVIGIDIGKNVFHLIGLDKCGAIVLKAKHSRSQLENRLPICRLA